ncbi:hotdog fold domain-containing protein [Promicromonospora panici]|uniref:hotdog fold domain-containing protein n=1 Tax=Promicromonospora panici TaxID=2219658 RepID=UPI00101DF8AA|nr:hotdog fold domain-containing protein [Promicromonospora panici]
MTTPLHAFWKSANSLPVIGGLLGKRIFTLAYTFKAPYFGSIAPRVVNMLPNRAEVVVPNRRRNRNHIGTVHAIAVCNGLEMAMGALAEATVPDDKRWLPKGMEVAYLAKSTGDVTCVAETDQDQWDGDDRDLPVRVRATLDDGTVVVQGTIHLWVTPKKK